MGELIVTTFITLDGVLQAPGGPDEDPDSFEHGGWQAPFFDETSGPGIFEQYQGADALLLGRRTYDIFSSYWPRAPADNPFTQLINELPRYVASGTLGEATWPGSTIVRDAAADLPEIKERHERILVAGSGGLIQTLLRHRFVDRLDLWLYPVAFGTGKRLFGDGTVPAAYRLEGSEAHAGGAVHLRYAYAGEPEYGDMSELD